MGYLEDGTIPDSPENHGAVGDGVTDDTAAIQSFVSSNVSPVFPGKTYKVSGNNVITVTAGKTITFQGTKFLHSTSTETTILASGVDDWNLLGAFTIVGAENATGSAIGIYVKDCFGWRIENARCETVKGIGLKVEGVTTNYAGALGLQGQVSTYQAKSCYEGFRNTSHTEAEYCQIDVANISGCTYGALVYSGNTTFSGGNITSNTNGLFVGNGHNHAHGIISGVNINHNENYNIYCDQIEYGQTFNGCHVFGDSAILGKIVLNACKGVKIVNGTIGAVVQVDGSTGTNTISHNYMHGSLPDLTGTGTAWVVARDNYTLTGYWSKNIHPGYAKAKRITTTQAITSGVATTLVFNSAEVDKRSMVNTGTGEITVREAGEYRITLAVQVNGTNITAGFIQVHKNNTSTELSLIPMDVFSTSYVMFFAAVDAVLAASDKIFLNATVTGTSPEMELNKSFLSVELIS